MRAAATAMLQSGDPANSAARQRAVAVILGAGAQGYGDGNLDHDRAEAAGQAIGQVAQQLTPDAKEWFLAEVIRVGTADGPLTESERHTARAVAADLGMSPAQAIGVITLAEQAAQD